MRQSRLLDRPVAAEDNGWDAFFIWDHLLYRDQRWPVADPTVVIAAVAARTSRIRFGVLMNQLARRRVGKVARESVTLDRLSGGRLILGAGLGSVPEEFTAFGEPGDLRERAARLDESLEVLTELWRGEPVTFHSEHVTVTVTGVTMLPSPLQQPRIPIWCGGRWPNKAPFRRAARWDGVMPTHTGYGLGRPCRRPNWPPSCATSASTAKTGPRDWLLRWKAAPTARRLTAAAGT